MLLLFPWHNWIRRYFDVDNFLIDEKLHKNIFIYDISYKFLIGLKPLRVRFDKIDVEWRVWLHGIYYGGPLG